MDASEPIRLELPSLRFSWDITKAEENIDKHGVSFAEAATVFLDPLALYLEPELIDGEPRERIVGWSLERRTVLVVHTERGTLIRIISARPPTRAERSRYEEG